MISKEDSCGNTVYIAFSQKPLTLPPGNSGRGKEKIRMSNALRKKKKKMEPLGYTKEELGKIEAYSRMQSQNKDMINNIRYTLRNMTFFVLYAKFDFGKIKLRNFEKAITAYKEEYKAGKINMPAHQEELKNRSHIDLYKYALSIPSKEKCKMAGAVNLRAKEDIQQVGSSFRGAYQTYLTMILTLLKKKMKFTEKMLKEFMYWVNYNINSFYRGDIDDNELIRCLEEENGYQL